MKLKSLVSLAAFGLSALAASAFPIAVGGEGFTVVAGSTDDIIATYQGTSASYSNNLYLDGFGFIFNNQSSAWGSTVNLGSYATGTVLQFRLQVTNTGYTYATGAASLNPDNHIHARVQNEWAPGTTLVSFEDLFNGPFDYNDLSFSFTNTQAAPVSTPDGASTAGCLALAGVGLLGLARRRARQSSGVA